MEQYISKSSVMAEIEKKKIPFKRDVEDGNYPTYLCALMDFEDFINTLEIKEVDLDKEARHYLLNEHKSPLSAVFHQTDLHSEIQYHEDIENTFKAGFKLALKIQKGDKL